MKKVIRGIVTSFLFAAFFLGITTSLQATQYAPFVKIENADSKAFTLHLESGTAHKTWVQIKDENGYIMFEEQAEATDKFARKYVLAQLPIGMYTVHVVNDFTERVQPVTLTDSSLLINPAEMQLFFKPVITFEDDKVDVYLPVPKETVTIQLMDKHNNVLMTEQLEKGSSVQRRYNLTQLSRGDYRLKVATPNQIVVEELAIR